MPVSLIRLLQSKGQSLPISTQHLSQGLTHNKLSIKFILIKFKNGLYMFNSFREQRQEEYINLLTS